MGEASRLKHTNTGENGGGKDDKSDSWSLGLYSWGSSLVSLDVCEQSLSVTLATRKIALECRWVKLLF
jgi:hypothetical protein